jgi:hypothetical protein
MHSHQNPKAYNCETFVNLHDHDRDRDRDRDHYRELFICMRKNDSDNVYNVQKEWSRAFMLI